MKRAFVPFLIATLAVLTSCGPIKMFVDVESKGDTLLQIPITGKKLAVVSVSDTSNDSIYVSALGVGLAEEMENGTGLQTGAVGVYTVSSDRHNIREAGTLDLLAVQTGCDMLIALDSLYMGSYTIIRDANVYYMSQYEHTVDIRMPISFNVTAYDASSLETLHSRKVSDTLSWTLMGDDDIPNSSAIYQANAYLEDGVKSAGIALAGHFLPSWNKEERMITCFQGAKWENAYYLALDFKWEQAMDIWLELVKNSSPQKQGCAAYNLAVACEILGRYDTALKWLDFAESKCYFAQMSTLRRMLQK